VALGFPSWTAYIADVFHGQVLLDRDQRRELVGYLAGEGMSQRAIADVVSADRKTVRNDLAEQVGETGPPRSPVTGLDGKVYPKPAPREPSKPRRGPITDEFSRAATDLTKVANRIARLGADDRFNKNREVLSYRASDITRAIQALIPVLAQLRLDQLGAIDDIVVDFLYGDEETSDAAVARAAVVVRHTRAES
jgi:hypothetical protein